MDENKLMLEFLSNKFGTSDQKEIQKKLNKLDKEQQQALAQEYQQWKAKRKTKAAHGAKLDYVKSLKHICPEGQELYYYKKGGLMKCGCKDKKLEEGAKVEEAKCGAVAKFKKVKKGKFGITAFVDATGSQGGFRKAQQEKKNEKEKEQQNQQKEGWDKYGNYVVRKKNIKEREKQLAANKTEEETTPPKINKGIHKNACGSKIKKDCGGAVAKFKSAKCGSKMKKHQQGGSFEYFLSLRNK